MNRLQFLKMMRNSLMETVKEASAPLLEDEVEKVKTLFLVIARGIPLACATMYMALK